MVTNNGEHVLDALLTLGYDVEITDEGKITATHGTDTLNGKAEHGAIEWSNRPMTFRIIEQAYIARLRKRIADSHS